MAYGESPPNGGISLERVFSRAAETVASNSVATIGIAFLLSALPTAIAGYGFQQIGRGALRAGSGLLIGVTIGSALLGMVFTLITQGALVRATTAHEEGRRAGIGECLEAGFVVALPLLGVAILTAIGVALASILLIVPGIMLYTAWCVAAPAAVDERLGPIEALERSRDLTRGARWKVFGLLLLLMVLSWILQATLTAILTAAYGGRFAFVTATAQAAPGALIATTLVGTITAVVSAVMHAALFLELRAWKDGPRTEHLAEVFA